MHVGDFSSAGAPNTDRFDIDSSALNIDDISNNADQVSGMGRGDKTFGQDPNNNSSAFMLAITGEEEGDDYESDFEQDQQITPSSAASPFVNKRRIKSRSNAQSNGAFSPKLYS